MISSSTVAKPDRNAPKMKNGGNMRRMPADGGGAGEVQPDDAVHRADQRRHDRRQHTVKRVVMLPLPAGAAKAQSHRAVEHLLRRVGARSRSVARSGSRPRYQNTTDDVT